MKYGFSLVIITVRLSSIKYPLSCDSICLINSNDYQTSMKASGVMELWTKQWQLLGFNLWQSSFYLEILPRMLCFCSVQDSFSIRVQYLLVQIGPQLLAKCWNEHLLQNMTCTSVLSRYIFVPDKLLKLEKCADLCYFLYIFQTTTNCLKLY